MRTIACLFPVLLFLACNNQPVDTAQEKLKLMATDSAFSRASKDLGMRQAFLLFSDSAVIELNEGSFPTQGIQEMERRQKAIDDSKFQLTWEPLRCEVAKSGDLGYTFGNWEIITKNTAGTDSSTYGNYISVWKKQRDNSWKIVLDGGNSAPAPSRMRIP
jgi:ketosteroid isomerase-like protein